MRAEIREQPAALARALRDEHPRVERLSRAARERDIRLLYLAARGTSDHAAVYLKYLCEILTGIPAGLAAPSVVTLYGASVRYDRALVMGISQSGRAADALEVLRDARDRGQLTGCITNEADSPMAAAVEHPLCCRAGAERSLPATKTYTASLALAADLVATLADRGDLRNELSRVPELVGEILGREEELRQLAAGCAGIEECVVLSRGINLCTALEAALKLSETSYLTARPFSTADFLHGPIAAVDPGTLCLVFAPAGPALPFLAEVADRLRERQVELMVFSDAPDMLARARIPITLPPCTELLSPITSIVALQLFACHLALARGLDPDRPRGLLKVTRTL